MNKEVLLFLEVRLCNKITQMLASHWLERISNFY